MKKTLLIVLLILLVLVAVVLGLKYKSHSDSNSESVAQKQHQAVVPAPQRAEDTKPVIVHEQAPVTSQNNDYKANLTPGLSNESLLAMYNDLINKDRNDGNSYYQRALVYLKMQNYSRAIDDFGSALQSMPNSVNCYYQRAAAKMQDHSFESAIADYSSAINLDPNNPKLYIGRGQGYTEVSDLVAALNDLNKALSLNSNYDRSYFVRGTVYEKQKRYAEAKSDYDKAIQLNKTDEEDIDAQATMTRMLNAYYRRAIVNLNLYDLASAMADVNYVLQYNKIEPKVYRLRAAINTQMGNVSDAAADTALANKLESGIHK